MKAIPTVDNPGYCYTCGAVQTLATNDVGSSENLTPLNLYYQPGGTPGSDQLLYRQPLSVSTRPEGDLYLAPA